MNILTINILVAIICLSLGYIFGSIPTAVWVGKIFFHQDPRDYGSHNAGGTNAGRLWGKKVGFVIILLDMIKTIAPLYICWACLTFIKFDYNGISDAANLANLYAGLCYANLNKWQEAVNSLEAYSSSNDAMVSPAAQAALGNAYAHLNQLDKAVAALKKAAKMADSKAEDDINNSLSPTFLLQAAEILESQGNKADALEIYQDIKKNYVNSALVQSQEIEKYIERASR